MFALLNPSALHLQRTVVLALLGLLGLILLLPTPVRAQDADEKAQNLANCLARKGPGKCKKQWLNPDDVWRVEDVERRENQRICLTGRTPESCDRALLSLKEIQQTIIAERRENLKSCLMGFSRERRACRKDWLTEVDLKRVEAAEQTRTHCANGKGGSECGALLLPPKPLKPAPTATAPRPPKMAKTAAVPASAGAESVPTAPAGPEDEFATCEVDQFVDAVSAEGRVAELQDGSIWVVALKDADKILAWVLPAYVVACEGRLIHGETGEIIAAKQQR
ncbi:hypothetical protein [Leptothrix ochracea]|uniref:hypothetical protein n=1 Tax=Leptothrix ochracea TaxID=735331 RepID=UPI0034E1B228